MNRRIQGEIPCKPIGIIHSTFKEARGTPIQPAAAKSTGGTVEIFPEYAGGLKDLEGFSHIYLLFHFHLSKGYSLQVRPYLDDEMRGVFATRAPRRPVPIGLSVVRLRSIDGNILQIEDVDIVDGTPLLDIKPYVPGFDSREDVRTGWLEKRINGLPAKRDDGRFVG